MDPNVIFTNLSAKISKNIYKNNFYNTIDKGTCGLKNLGNSCYINAIFQALRHSENLC